MDFFFVFIELFRLFSVSPFFIVSILLLFSFLFSMFYFDILTLFGLSVHFSSRNWYFWIIFVCTTCCGSILLHLLLSPALCYRLHINSFISILVWFFKVSRYDSYKLKTLFLSFCLLKSKLKPKTENRKPNADRKQISNIMTFWTQWHFVSLEIFTLIGTDELETGRRLFSKTWEWKPALPSHQNSVAACCLFS